MHRSDRQLEIIQMSLRIIATRGIQNLTTKNIAREIGISEAALYRHFESKLAILIAILDEFEQDADRLLKLLTHDGPVLDRLTHFMQQRYQTFRDNPDLSRVMFSNEIFMYEEQLAQRVVMIMHKHKILIVECLIEGQTRGEIRADILPKDVFRLLIGSMRLTVTQWYLTNYGFDLEADGFRLWESLKRLIQIG